MAKSTWGDPLTAFRLPAAALKALQKMASDESTTVSQILRKLAIAELKAKGYTITDEPLEGQTKIE